MRKVLWCLLALACSAITAGAQTGSTLEQNKALVRRFYEEVWSKGNLDFADQVFAEDYVRHDPRGGTPPAGPRGQKLIAANFRKSCPDCRFVVDFMVAEGDKVAARWTIRGTHVSGKPIDFVGVNIFRFANGKVVEVWNHRDDLAFALQTGRVTMAPPAAAPPQPAPTPEKR